MVTAETAVILPFLVALTFLLLWVVGLGISQVRVTDASRQAARMIARGDSTDVAKSTARQAAGSDADVVIESAHGYVTVSVSAHAKPPFMPSIGTQEMSSQTVAAVENTSDSAEP